MATIAISLLIFLGAAAGLALGQCFGRPPVYGRCTPPGVLPGSAEDPCACRRAGRQGVCDRPEGPTRASSGTRPAWEDDS